MINIIWFGLLFIGIVVGIATGNVEAITKAAIEVAARVENLASSNCLNPCHVILQSINFVDHGSGLTVVPQRP